MTSSTCQDCSCGVFAVGHGGAWHVFQRYQNVGE